MSNLKILENYLKNKLDKFKDAQTRISVMKENRAIATEIINLLKNSDYSSINLDKYQSLLQYIDNGNDFSHQLKKLSEAIELSTFMDMIDEVQIRDIKEYFSEVELEIQKIYNTLDIRIYKEERRYHDNTREYEDYLSLFNENGIQRHLDKQALEKFFNFLKNSSLSEEVIFELIIEFSKDSLEYHKGLKKLKAITEGKLTRRNSRKVAAEINDKVKSEVAVTKPKDEVVVENLTPEEQKIIDEIKQIAEVLEKDVKDENPITELLNSNYDLSFREKIYSSSNDIWNIILNDIKENLLPNIKTEKEKIIEIFKYIIKIYNEKYEKEREKEVFVSEIADFTDQEKKQIDYFVDLAKKELEYYDNLPGNEKNLIRSMQQLIDNQDFDILNELNSKYSQRYVQIIKIFKELLEKYNEYIYARKDEEEWILEGDKETSNEIIISLMTDIRRIIEVIAEEYKLLKEERKGNESTNVPPKEKTFNSKKKNIILFLPKSEKEYYISDEQNQIIQEGGGIIKDLPAAINHLTSLGFEEYKKGANLKKVKCDKKFIETELNPHRIRRDNIRIGYIVLSVSQNNKDRILLERNISDDFRIILFFGVEKKNTSDHDAYDYFNRQLDQEYYRIQNIRKIFSEDFSEESYQIALKLIDDGELICDSLMNDPFAQVAGIGPEGIGGRKI